MINTITLKLTDGIDTFLGEITGERAAFYLLTRTYYHKYRHPVGSACPMDGGWRGDGDTGKWHGLVRLFRDAARMGDVP